MVILESCCIVLYTWMCKDFSFRDEVFDKAFGCYERRVMLLLWLSSSADC